MHVGVALRHQQQLLCAIGRRAYGSERPLASDQEGHGDMGKHHHVAKWKDRQPKAAGP